MVSLTTLFQQNLHWGKTVLGTPIIVVVEAKRNDFIEGWGQCLAELVAIQRINDDNFKACLWYCNRWRDVAIR